MSRYVKARPTVWFMMRWSFQFILLFLFAEGIQENAYHRVNFLKFLSDFLGNQVSLTSFFGLTAFSCAGIMFLSIFYIVGLKREYIPLWFIFLVPFPLGCLNTLYEIWQTYHPQYFDNNVLDIIAGWLGVVVTWLIISIMLRKKS